MKPKFKEIDEVQIYRPSFKKKIKIGTLKNDGEFGGGINSQKPHFFGKVIELENASKETLFLKK